MTPALISLDARGAFPRRQARVESLEVRQTFSRHIREGRSVSLRHAGGLGHFWVTFEGDKEDYLLSPGGTLEFQGPGLLVAEAIEAGARLSLG